MTTLEAKTFSPNVHLPISLPMPLRARLDAEAAERKCSRASIVIAAIHRWYGDEEAAFRPTGEAHRQRVLRFAEAEGTFTYADVARAAGLEYGTARRYVLQLVDAGLLAANRAGTPRSFRVAERTKK